MYDSLKKEYVYPSNLLQRYQQFQYVSTLSDNLFAKIYERNNPGQPNPYDRLGGGVGVGGQPLSIDSKMLSGITKFHDPLIMRNTPDFLKRPNPIT
jgi:hypothetical protein